MAEYDPLAETRDIISKTYEQIQVPEEHYVATFVDREGGVEESSVTERSSHPTQPERSGLPQRKRSLRDRLLSGGIFRGALFDPQGAAERLREEIAEQRRISETPIFTRADSLRIMEDLFGAEGSRKIQEEARAQRVQASVNRVLKKHYDKYGTDEEKAKFYRESLGMDWHPDETTGKRSDLPPAGDQP